MLLNLVKLKDMDYIKNIKEVIESANQLVNCCGSPQIISANIDSLIFDYLNCALRQRDCSNDYEADRIQNLKAVRDFFSNMELTSTDDVNNDERAY